ncbi:P-loop containing nucleoside triphosphate hydrolase protein [Ochromonadaceae sp. CCMP2298]|nr:P-loop containing nucleoside triphosphate hydrolase protein [Ochromonadaceae sp. CCMP2298]
MPASTRPFSLNGRAVQSSATSSDTQEKDSVVFAGLKFGYPVAQALKALRIEQPTPIQKSSLAPIATGMSCLIHAATGTGKTLCFLLPILKKLYSDEADSKRPFQALIMVPTKELAVQIASDIASLTNGDKDIVHLCLSGVRKGLGDVTAPIIVGTPYKIRDAIQATGARNVLPLLAELDYLVLDEVDRMLHAVGKYATQQDRKTNQGYPNPALEVIDMLVKVKSRMIFKQSGIEMSDSILDSDLQLVASSATVGRPLRRELHRLFQTAVPVDGSRQLGGQQYGGQLPVLRPAGGSEGTRQVGIPDTIRHVAMLDSEEYEDLAGKLGFVKEKWLTGMRRGILFVPSADDVQQVRGILKYWGLDHTKDLQQALKIAGASNRMSGTGDGTGDATGDAPAKGDYFSREMVTVANQEELLSQAQTTRMGSISRKGADGAEAEGGGVGVRELFVIPLSGSRGLHLQDVECVMMLIPPRTMDEYLHAAGRTGRMGNKVNTGIVYTVATMEELKRLQSWQTPLGIDFEILYS